MNKILFLHIFYFIINLQKLVILLFDINIKSGLFFIYEINRK